MVVRSMVIVSALLAVAGGVANAAMLATAPLAGGTDYKCQAVNVGRRGIEIDLEIHAANGGNVASTSCMGVLPLHTCSLSGDQFSSYCLVTVKSRRTVRAALTAMNGGVPIATVPAQ